MANGSIFPAKDREMSLLEPRCLVCGAPLDKYAIFEKEVRKSEVCSDKCYEIYMFNEDAETKGINELHAHDDIR